MAKDIKILPIRKVVTIFTVFWTIAYNNAAVDALFYAIIDDSLLY